MKLALLFCLLLVVLEASLVLGNYVKTNQNIYVRSTPCNTGTPVGHTIAGVSYQSVAGRTTRCKIEWCKIKFNGVTRYIACFFLKPASGGSGSSSGSGSGSSYGNRVNCRWSSWRCGDCNCGGSKTKTCTRTIDVQAQNGGTRCSGPSNKNENCRNQCSTSYGGGGGSTGVWTVPPNEWNPGKWQAFRSSGNVGYCNYLNPAAYCGECVSFVGEVTHMTGATITWKKGENVWSSRKAKRGDAICTFFANGGTRYMGHVAIFVAYQSNGIQVYHQNWGGKRYVSLGTIYKGRSGTSGAENYYLIRK